jgi:trk system potassium uptake protein TrkH
VLLFTMRSMIQGREHVEAFGRTLPARTVSAALSVFVIYVTCAVTGLFLLALSDPQMSLQDQAFELVSALSTVGLSTGITSQFSPAGKLVLCLAMFVGRVGPIALVLSIFQATRHPGYRYPEEEIVVG